MRDVHALKVLSCLKNVAGTTSENVEIGAKDYSEHLAVGESSICLASDLVGLIFCISNV